MTAKRDGNRSRTLAAETGETRIDPLTGDLVYIVAERQDRPNLPPSGCPFCPGGLEAPDDYDVFVMEMDGSSPTNVTRRAESHLSLPRTT